MDYLALLALIFLVAAVVFAVIAYRFRASESFYSFTMACLCGAAGLLTVILWRVSR